MVVETSSQCSMGLLFVSLPSARIILDLCIYGSYKGTLHMLAETLNWQRKIDDFENSLDIGPLPSKSIFSVKLFIIHLFTH